MRTMQKETMPNDFQFDVFLSHSAKDKAVVRDVAARLKQDGVRVWLDAEQIKPGDSIPAKIETGLPHSALQSLAFSLQPLLRAQLNQERRFIPLRLDDAPIKGSLTQFLYINWRPEDRQKEYVKLLDACRPSAT